MKKCPSCGKENDDTDSVCFSCGTDLGFQNQVLYEIYKRIGNVDKNVGAIKGWVTFMGVILLISLLLSLFGGCTALL